MKVRRVGEVKKNCYTRLDFSVERRYPGLWENTGTVAQFLGSRHELKPHYIRLSNSYLLLLRIELGPVERCWLHGWHGGHNPMKRDRSISVRICDAAEVILHL